MADISTVTRRQALWIAGLGCAASLGGLPAQGGESRDAVAREAYIWGLPLVQTRLYLKLARQRGLPFNQLFGAPGLSTPASKVAGPNLDTLYGAGWLDLTAEPQILSVPDTHDRYYSIQLIDSYENSFRYIGRRATGTKAGHFAIVGPGWHCGLPDGVTPVAAPTKHVLALTRTLVTGDADLPAALAVQAGYSLTPLSEYPGIANPDRLSDSPLSIVPVLRPADLGVVYFDELGAALADYPPPARERAFVERLAVLGIGPGETPSKTDSKPLRDLLASAAISADRQIRSRFANGTQSVNGWRVRTGVTEFISDPLERASVNVLGPGFHIAKEALYFFLNNGPDGQPLNGKTAYLLRFPAGELPPVDAFWSLTLYGTDWYLQDNSINRYAIGDRTAALKRGNDGSLQIHIQHQVPTEGISNWLPAPTGPFQLCLRTYQPRPALFNGRYRVPPLALA
jgi:hypothetical protein